MFTVVVLPCTMDGTPCRPSVHTFHFALFANAFLETLTAAYHITVKDRTAIAIDALAIA